ncbi:hypothetical protein LCGC14_1704430 [marine sediment metagenome]|uniref:Uncharacterized protein n=1 Tax=marine sediment metagenome TaxID=412755 RepID=A0A0F9KH48_9ZZZZ
MSLPNTIHAASALAVHKTLYTSESEFKVGQKLEYADGRRFRFALAGELLVLAEILQGVDSTAENNLTPVAANIGDTTLSVTIGNVAVADYFKGGYVYVDTDPAVGETYKVGSHLAYTAASGQIINLAGDETLLQNITTTSRVSLVRNPWSGLISLATTPTAWVAGVAVSAVLSAGWGWVQTGGPAAVMCGTQTAEGASFAASDDTAGTGGTANADSEFIIGSCMVTGPAADRVELVFLTID